MSLKKFITDENSHPISVLYVKNSADEYVPVTADEDGNLTVIVDGAAKDSTLIDGSQVTQVTGTVQVNESSLTDGTQVTQLDSDYFDPNGIGALRVQDVSIQSRIVQPQGDQGIALPQREGSGEFFNVDTNLERVFGTQNLLNPNQRIKVDPLSYDVTFDGNIAGANSMFGVNPTGYATATIQVSGTWTGTLTFEASADGGNIQGLQGININSVVPATTATANGIFRFNVVGLKLIRARFSTATSGKPHITIVLSVTPGVTSLPGDLYGANTNALPQRSSTNELWTYDTGLNASVRTTTDPQVIDPSVLTSESTATSFNKPSSRYWPQVYPRLRVEAGGSQKLPFAQDPNNNRMMVSFPELQSLMEAVVYQLTLQNQLTARAFNLALPVDFQELK